MNKILIEVIYAQPHEQKRLEVWVQAGATIQEAITSSGILAQFPEIDLSRQKVGVFGKMKPLSEPLKAGDRVEIYRSLLIDPKEARRAKAKKSLRR
jgi:uncharacterized protein